MEPKKLYRYRKPESYNIDAFCNDKIVGSLYSSFKDQGELNFYINHEPLLKYGIPPDVSDGFLRAIVNNCCNNYFMACFSETDPFSSSYVRNRFAGPYGFCIVYSYESIREQIVLESFNDKRIEIKPVHYNDNPFDVCPVVEPLAKIVIENEQLTDKEKDALVNDYLEDKENSSKLGKYVVEGFVHKKRKYHKEKEVRIILQRNDAIRKENEHPVIMFVKPIKVYISRHMEPDYKKRIIDHATELGIPWYYLPD